MSTDGGGFFSRWSRRKAENAAPTVNPPAVADAPAVAGGSPTVVVDARPPAGRDAAAVPAERSTPAAAPAAPAPTLDDVVQLTHESDFSPYVGRAVAPEVRNAAMKKLFADPHFNVMDGLDIYIDDYTKPSPLPAELLKKMVSAQFMNLVEPEPEPEPTTAVGPAPAPEAAQGPESHPAASAASAAEAPPPPADHPAPALPTPTATAHDHLDLQLQPDHAPRPGGPGSGT
jgi:hypothetical protein